jgi:hypothetical protein
MAYYYTASKTVDPAELPLTSEDWVFIRAIASKYGSMSREAVVAASKRTGPMQHASQYDTLEFVRNPKVEALKQTFFDDSSFVKQTKRVLGSTGGQITLEDLRAQVGEPSKV